MNLKPEIIDEEGKGILFARVASKLLKEGKIEQATLISEVGIKKFPYYAQGHFVLGKCYQEKDMYEEARAEYERVLRFDSMHLGAMKELAGLYHSNGLKDVYKDYLYKLLTLDPLNSTILEECRAQGVYEVWKSSSPQPLAEQTGFAEDFKLEDLNFDEESENIEKESAAEKKETEDLLKIDLNQFENQDDDFTTIMDGLIQETSEESDDVDASDYLKDLETPVEIESELLAEEKPIEESIDELDAFEKEEFEDDEKSSYLELDYGKKTEDQHQTIEEKDEFSLEDEDDTLSLKKEIDQEPEEVENAFAEPKLRVQDLEVKDKNQANNAHDKTELIFEETEENVELEFEDETENQEKQKIVQESDIEKEQQTEEQELKLEPELDSEIKIDRESGSPKEIMPEIEEKSSEDDKSPYVKQKIVSQTLAEILVSQNKYKEAKQVFLALKEQQPDNPNIDKKLEILNKIIALDEKKE
jgi:hypothetical protein